MPFFIRPKIGAKTAPIAFLAPTLTYLTYGNEHSFEDPKMRETLGVGTEISYPRQPQDKYIVATRLSGLYDHHSDGSGVCYTSRLKPIVTMRPKYKSPGLVFWRGSPHGLSADLWLLDWLEAKGYHYDVITDEDLHSEGESYCQTTG